MIPPDIIDHVLSFLQEDRATLNVCINAHPSLSSLAERHFYAHVTVENFDPGDSGAYQPSDLLKHIVDNPNIANYIRNLRIRLSIFGDGDYQPLESILVAVTQLRAILLTSTTPGPVVWDCLSESFRTAFTHCLRLPTLTGVDVSKIEGFPLSTLDHSRSLKTLSLFGGFYSASSALPLVYPPLDSLVLHYCSSSMDVVTSWAESRSVRSLKFNGHFALFSQLLAVCANTLTSLNVHIPLDFRTIYDSASNNPTAFPPIPFSLACLPHLAKLTVQSQISFEPKFWKRSDHTDSCLHAITHLLNTLPCPPINLVHLVFNIDLEIFNILDLCDTDWSPLLSFLYLDIIPCIELQVRASKWSTKIPSVDLFKVLNQDPHLIQLGTHQSFLVSAAEEPVDSSEW